MSDARPITNVTEYVCGACWNGFGALDPGVRGSDGSLTCPHCCNLQVESGDWTAMVQGAADTEDAPDQPEVDFADTLPGPTAGDAALAGAVSTPEAFAVVHTASPAGKATAEEAPPAADEGAAAAHGATVSAPAALVDDDPEPTIALADATDGFEAPSARPPALDDDSDLMAALADASAALGAEAAAGHIAGDAELSVDLGEDTPVSQASASPAARQPILNTAEELLAFLDAAEADGVDDAFYGETMASLPSVFVAPNDGAPRVGNVAAVASAAHAADDAEGNVDPLEFDTAEVRRPRSTSSTTAAATQPGVASGFTTAEARVAGKPAAVAKAAAAEYAPDLAATMDDDDDDEAAILAENTSPDLEIADLSPEPSEWKLRAPPGLTYNFHSVDALLGWASNRSTEGLQVSVDGQTWRPVGPFLDALRAGHRGRKAFALAQVPEMVASLRDGSRTALDDIRDVDVRDEVLRALESRAPGQPSAPELILTSRPTSSRRGSRTSGAVEPAEEPKPELQAPAPEEPAEETRGGRRPTLRSMPQVVGGVTMQPTDEPGLAARPGAALPTGRPSGERRSQSPLPRTTGEQRVGAVAAAGKSQPSSQGIPVAASRARPSSARTVAAPKQASGTPMAAKIAAGLVIVGVIAVIVLHVLGIVRLPLP